MGREQNMETVIFYFFSPESFTIFKENQEWKQPVAL